MKDLPHFIKRLNRKIIRSEHREELDEETIEKTAAFMSRKQTVKQKKKQAKAKIAKAKKARTQTPEDSEEKNKKMAKRVPIFFDRNHEKPKTVRRTRKKTPRI